MPLILNGDGSVGPLSATEVGYLDGVTSTVQTQINTSQSQINSINSCGYFAQSAGVTIAAGVGVTIPLDTTYISNGISLSSNSFTFTKSGFYMINWGCRPGAAADVWSVIDLHNSTTGIVGKSFGFGTIATDVGARMAHFMANITNISVSYTLRMTRTSSMVIDNPTEGSYPETIPSIGVAIWKVG